MSEPMYDPSPSAAAEGRKKLKVPVSVRVFRAGKRALPYLLVLEPKKHSDSPQKDYDVEWFVQDTEGYSVRLVDVVPQDGTGTVTDKTSTANGRKLTYDVDVGGDAFRYDLMYEIDGGETCEAYAEPPSGEPTCQEVVQARHPPPEILIP